MHVLIYSLQRLFIRHCNTLSCTTAQASHKNFNSWELEHYNSIEEEEWKTIMESDTAYNYEVFGHGLIEITAQTVMEHAPSAET